MKTIHQQVQDALRAARPMSGPEHTAFSVLAQTITPASAEKLRRLLK